MRNPTITVTEPCTCGARRWFQCGCPIVATYQCHRGAGTYPEPGAGRPHPEDIAAVQAAHPGKTLIY